MPVELSKPIFAIFIILSILLVGIPLLLTYWYSLFYSGIHGWKGKYTIDLLPWKRRPTFMSWIMMECLPILKRWNRNSTSLRIMLDRSSSSEIGTRLIWFKVKQSKQLRLILYKELIKLWLMRMCKKNHIRHKLMLPTLFDLTGLGWWSLRGHQFWCYFSRKSWGRYICLSCLVSDCGSTKSIITIRGSFS